MRKHRHQSSLLVFLVIHFSFFLILSTATAADKHKIQNRRIHRQGELAKADRSKTARRGLRMLSKDPYLGAIVADASTGKALFEDGADVKGYPASIVKLMNLLVILEAVDEGQISLEDRVTISAESAKIGGSQVYLKEKEVHTVNDLLYALVVQSANDAAVALALHAAGSREAFVTRMNSRARGLGMNDTVFHSVHGLPPGRGQLPDISTPRDIVKLCRKLLKHPRTLQYTSTKKRLFRTDAPEPFIMENHNHLVRTYKGCDGLKTGYFRAAGYSIAATAVKDGARAIAVIFGSVDSKVRDKKARTLLSKGLTELSSDIASPRASAVPGTRPFAIEVLN